MPLGPNIVASGRHFKQIERYTCVNGPELPSHGSEKWMHRLFVALRPPPALRGALLAHMGGIAGARWQNDDQLHLTLRFLGEVDRHQAEDIVAALGAVAHPPLTMKLHGIGCFDRRGRIAAIWAGVTPHDQVRSLHAAVSRQLARVGIGADERAFTPHITIARFSRGQEPSAPLALDRLWPPPIEGRFDRFLLYESELTATGPAYSVIERYPLV